MPPPSPSWLTVPVFGKYRKLDGSAHSGSILFSVSTRVVSVTDDLIFPAGSTFEVQLDSNGHISVSLPCVDDPDNSPADWSIRVEEKLTAGGGLTYEIQPRVAMAPDGLNLRTVVLDDPALAVKSNAVALRGVPGGLAQLDSDGDVIDADGNKVIASGGGTELVPDETAGTWTSNEGVVGYTQAKTDELLAAKADESALATVATTGSYLDLADKPSNPLNSAGHVPVSKAAAGAVFIIEKVGGVWPSGWTADDQPIYTGGSTSAGVRLSSRADIKVWWVGADPSPATVPSGTGGMLNGDMRVLA